VQAHAYGRCLTRGAVAQAPRRSAGVGEFIHKRPSKGVNGCACERTSETASAFLLACRPAVGFLSVFLFPDTLFLFSPSLLFSLSLSLSHPFFLPIPPLFYSVDYRRLYDATQPSPPSSPYSCMECNDQSFVEILYSRYLYAFISFSFFSMHFSFEVSPLSRIGHSDDSKHYAVILLG